MRRTSGNHLNLASAFILLIVAPACLADLMCYVCDDCVKVTKETPLLTCNEDFFNHGGSSEASTITTTASTIPNTEDDVTSSSSSSSTEITSTTTEASTEASSPAPTSSTTTEPASPTTTEESTTDQLAVESTESTQAPIPTPATAGPLETTTVVPTPPAVDLGQQLNATRLLPSFDIDVAAPASSTELNIRQRRAMIDTKVSYHCYTVQKTINNTNVTERGCSRVETQQSVCQELQMQNNNIQLGKCDPCSMNACNGVSSVMQSSVLATALIALIAAALQRN